MKTTSLPVRLTRMIRLGHEIEALSAMAAAAGRRDMAACCAEAADGVRQWIAETAPGSHNNAREVA